MISKKVAYIIWEFQKDVFICPILYIKLLIESFITLIIIINNIYIK